MVPLSLLRYDVRDREVVPAWLGPHDHAWLRGLLDEFERFVGRPRWELRRRLSEPLPVEGSSRRVDVARNVLDGIWPLEVAGKVRPRIARARLFDEAARGFAGARDELVAKVARDLEIEPEALREALFADLPGQRKLARLEPPLSPLELALRTNLAIAQSILLRASAVRIRLVGRARDVVRYARFRGLVCTVLPGDDHDAAVLELSGPLALFRRTLAYGHSLASLLPRLSWCNRFELHADCVLGELRRTLVLRSGDPIFPPGEPTAFDSRVERRFAQAFARLAPDWDIIREPEAIPAAGTLIFPDFAIQHRVHPERRWLLEIAGFWTPDYLVGKLRRLRDAQLGNLILCIDEERNCAAEDLPPGARVVRYRKHVDPAAILGILEGAIPGRIRSAMPSSHPSNDQRRLVGALDHRGPGETSVPVGSQVRGHRSLDLDSISVPDEPLAERDRPRRQEGSTALQELAEVSGRLRHPRGVAGRNVDDGSARLDGDRIGFIHEDREGVHPGIIDGS